MSAPEHGVVLGAAHRGDLGARLTRFASRARAARQMGKPLDSFLKESGRDWVRAPVCLLLPATTWDELERDLALAAEWLQAGGPFPDDPRVRVEGLDPGPGPDSPTAAPAGNVADVVRQVAIRLTGYSAEDLAAGRDLRRDLGLDSLKHAQLLEALWDLYGVPVEPDLQVADYPNLASMAAFLASRPPRPGLPARVEYRATRPAVHEREPAPLIGPACPAVRDQVAGLEGVDPTGVHLVTAGPGTFLASTARRPLNARRLDEDGGQVGAVGPVYLEPRPVLDWWKQRLGGLETSLGHVVGALMARFLSEVVREEPHPAPGPRIYLSNHQTALESYLFPLLAAALDGLPLEGVAMLDHGVDWADPMRDFMVSHQALAPDLVAPVRGVRSGDAWGLLRLLPQLREDLTSGRWSLHLAVEGARERAARHRLQSLSSVWIDLALELGLPLVPVRFLGGLPLEDPGFAQDLPVGFGAQSIHFGVALGPEELASLPPRERVPRVLEACNRLGDPQAELPGRPDPSFERALGEWLEYSGGLGIASVILLCLERHRPPEAGLGPGRHVLGHPTDAFVAAGHLGRQMGAPVALVLPPSADGRWVARLAEMAFGPHGPRVYLGRPAPEGFAAVVEVEEGARSPGR